MLPTDYLLHIQSLSSGKSYGNVSVEQGVSKSTVYKIGTKNCKNRTSDGKFDKKNLSGRSKKLSERDERTILRIIESGEWETAVEIT